MLPTFQEEQKVLLFTFAYFFIQIRVGDVIVLLHPVTKQKILKRITKVNDQKIFVIGDNLNASTDSRSFGWVMTRSIIGKVIYPV